MAKDYARSLYGNRKWKLTQVAYMISRNYICERCGSVARIVHHKNYITPDNIYDPKVVFDWDNLEAVCIDCHNTEHIISAATEEGLRFNSNGDIVSL